MAHGSADVSCTWLLRHHQMCHDKPLTSLTDAVCMNHSTAPWVAVCVTNECCNICCQLDVLKVYCIAIIIFIVRLPVS